MPPPLVLRCVLYNLFHDALSICMVSEFNEILWQSSFKRVLCTQGKYAGCLGQCSCWPTAMPFWKVMILQGRNSYPWLPLFDWVSKKVSSFTVRKGGKFITHNASYSESELDARLWKKNLKTQWTFTDGGNSRYGNTLLLHYWIPWENLC